MAGVPSIVVAAKAMNLPIQSEEFQLILSCVDERIDWIKRYALHAPTCVEELVKLEKLQKKLDYLSDEFMEVVD